MSQENVETVRLGYEALNRGDVRAVASLFDPDAEIATSLSVVEGGSYRAQEELRRWWRDVLQEFADVRFVGRDFTDFDDVVFGHHDHPRTRTRQRRRRGPGLHPCLPFSGREDRLVQELQGEGGGPRGRGQGE